MAAQGVPSTALRTHTGWPMLVFCARGRARAFDPCLPAQKHAPSSSRSSSRITTNLGPPWRASPQCTLLRHQHGLACFVSHTVSRSAPPRDRRRPPRLPPLARCAPSPHGPSRLAVHARRSIMDRAQPLRLCCLSRNVERPFRVGIAACDVWRKYVHLYRDESQCNRIGRIDKKSAPMAPSNAAAFALLSICRPRPTSVHPRHPCRHAMPRCTRPVTRSRLCPAPAPAPARPLPFRPQAGRHTPR